MTQKRASLMAASSTTKTVMLSATLVVCSMFNSGTQNAAEVLLAACSLESVSQVSTQHDLRCHDGSSSGRADGRTTLVLVSEKNNLKF